MAALDASLVAALRKPNAAARVFKDECMFSFETPFSPDGIYLNLNTFQSFSKKFVELDRERTGGRLYLRIKSVKVPKPAPEPAADGSAAPVTKFAVGVEGGFQTEDSKWMTETSFEVVQFPGPVTFPYPSSDLPAPLSEVIEAILVHTDAQAEDAAAAWEDKPEVTRFFDSLVQLPDAVKVSPDPKTWKCRDCDKRENLWMNLSDGYIGCGRRQPDGTGGNGHALAHFEATGKCFPLCVKLGTITPAGADVYSYDPTENDMVTDPNLAKHLANVGIDMMVMEKTEKSMAELNIAHNLSYEWAKILEGNGKELVPVKGPGFVGLTNMGNSCYINSTLQVLFALPEFGERFYRHADAIFRGAPADVASDLVTQLAKVAVGLLSDTYVKPAPAEGEKAEEDSVVPAGLKALVGRGHPEFSTNKQQDALEYVQHLFTLIRRAERTARDAGAAVGDVTTLFDFETEDKLRDDQSGMFRLKSSPPNQVWSLSIPLEAATNLSDVTAYEEQAAQKKMKAADGSATPASAAAAGSDSKAGEGEVEPVRHIVPFEAVLEKFAAPELLDDFRSPVTGAPGPASKVTRFKNFPRYLFMNLRRYILGPNWTPVKLEALVKVPEELNIEYLRSAGLQAGEEALPESAAATPAAAAAPIPDPDIVAAIASMGFSDNAAKRAALAVSNSGADAAVEWCFAHSSDPDFNDPLPAPAASAAAPAAAGFSADPESVAMVMSMGFEAKYAELALKETGGNLERAVDWLFSRTIPDLDALLAAAAGGGAATGVPAPAAGAAAVVPLEDGPGLYDLVGFISHIGKSTGSGHYVCHIKKDGKWTLFNDSKVALSEAPPFDMGYIYLFRRRT